MAYYYHIRVVREKHSLSKSFYPEPFKLDSLYSLAAAEFIHKALLWPATIRVEVEETDTQLYGYPEDKRRYQRMVLIPNARVAGDVPRTDLWRFFGLSAKAAYLDPAIPVHTINL
jgi:hypothetical protein